MIQYASIMREDMSLPRKRRRQDGLRAKFRALADPLRFTYPESRRKYRTAGGKAMTASSLTHPASWYLDGHLERRPINAAYAYARFAEWCLAKAKAGKVRDESALRASVVLFADTRRFLELIIRNTRAGVQFRKKDVDRYAPRVRQLCEEAREAFSKVHR